jgi:hypothetical protein
MENGVADHEPVIYGDEEWAEEKEEVENSEKSESSDFSRKEICKFATDKMSILKLIFDEDKEDVLLLRIYESVHNKIFMYIINNKTFGDEFFNDCTNEIHLCNSLVSKYNNHSDSQIYDDIIFSFYYSIIETLCEYEEWGLKNDR